MLIEYFSHIPGIYKNVILSHEEYDTIENYLPSIFR